MELISRETSHYGTPKRRIDNVCVSWQLLFCASFSTLMTVSRMQGGRTSGAVRSQAEPGNEETRNNAYLVAGSII
jgi:hypothetical protein